MIIKTDKEGKFDVAWAWAPVGEDGDLMIEYEDARPMASIAADWEGCQRITKESDEEGNAEYEGYTCIRSIVRRRRPVVQLTLMRE